MWILGFFKKVFERNRDEGIPVKSAIQDFLTKDTKRTQHHDKRLKEESNYETTYYEYKRIYEILKPKLSHLEIFCFFEKAALNMDKPNVLIDVLPDGRLLTFESTKTWFTWGPDMHMESV